MTFTFPKSALPSELTPAEKARREQQAADEYAALRETYRLARASQDAEVEAIRQRWQDEAAQSKNTVQQESAPEDDSEPIVSEADTPLIKILNVLSGRSAADIAGGQVVTATPKASTSFTPAQAFHPLGKFSGEVGRWFERRGLFSLLGKFSNQRGRWFE